MSDISVLVTPDNVSDENRVVLDYTSRDFAAIRAQLVGLAKGFMPEWETVGEAPDFGTLLLELFAYMGDVMHFYIDRTASEAFLGTAIRRQSVLYIADMFGYKPIGQQSATVKLEFSYSADADEDLLLPHGTRIHNNPDNSDDTIIFELETDILLTPGVGTIDGVPPITAYAVEGLSVNESLLGTGTGSPNAEWLIPDKGVVFGSISVKTVEGGRTVPWTFSTDLALARPTQNVFTTFIDEQELTHLVFGDNASGRIPPVNSQIHVSYRYGAGVEANSIEVGALTTFVPPPNLDLWGVAVTNPTKPVGGTDPETVESMRYSIPRAAGRIKNRAVTLNDYADLAMQVPGVAKSMSHGTVYTAVYVRIAPVGGNADDRYMVRLCAAVEAYMIDKVMVGSTVYAEPENVDELWRDLWIQMLVHVVEGYNRTQVRLNVDAAIRLLLSFDAVDFGYSVTIGQIYRTALSVPGVEWIELQVLDDEAPPSGTLAMEGGGTGGGPAEIVMESSVWTYSNSTNVSVDPTVNDLALNAGLTTIAISKTDSAGEIMSVESIKLGDHITLRQRTNSARWYHFIVNAAVTDNGTWVSIPVTRVETSAAGAPTPPQEVFFNVIRYDAPQEGLVDDLLVSEEEGTHLLIPRIAPMPDIKTAGVSTVSLTGNVATIMTLAAHGMNVGETVDVEGVTPTLFNGRYEITSAGSVTLTYAKTNADVASVVSTGTVKTVNLPESEETYPDMSEEERTHDGLWVVATGGVVNT